jgi:putative tryptophan/tyrosine transport system substrate-binding protein
VIITSRARCTVKKAAARSILVAVILLAVAVIAEAQQPKKVPRIAWLTSSPLSGNANRIEAFRQGLQELGYVEGKNIVIEYRSGEGNRDRVPALAVELVHLKVDVIVTAGASTTRSAKAATTTVPIVMAQDIDPVESGFVTSLARPGGNITGLSTLGPELSGKRLELLKEIVPKLSRVTVLGTSAVPGHSQMMREIERAAKAFNVELQFLDILDSKSIETSLRAASKGRAEAILTLQSPIVFSQRAQILDLAVKNRLPVMYFQTEYVEAGGLMSYSANLNDLARRAATYVDKILKGAKPADLPVEQPKKFEFIINLRAAEQIGLKIPPNVLARADRVIK